MINIYLIKTLTRFQRAEQVDKKYILYVEIITYKLFLLV